MPSARCKVPTCDRLATRKGAGLCEMHYSRLRRHGSFDLPQAPPPVNGGVCLVDDCTKPASTKGLCRQHYIRLWRHGSVEAYNVDRKDHIIHSGGYILTRLPSHPLATGSYVYEHRRVYFESGLPLVCHVCGADVTWDTCHIDHLDDCPTNNHIDNLRPACPACNQSRGVSKMRSTRRGQGVQITFRGETLCITEWGERLGISRTSIKWRLDNGWSVERALTEGRGKYGPKKKNR